MAWCLDEEKSLLLRDSKTTFSAICKAVFNTKTTANAVCIGTIIAGSIFVIYSSVASSNEIAALPDLNLTSIREIIDLKDVCLWGKPRWYYDADTHEYSLFHTWSDVDCPSLVNRVNESASLLADSCKKQFLCLLDKSYQYCLVCYNQGQVIDSYRCDINAYRQFEANEIGLKWALRLLLAGAFVSCSIPLSMMLRR
jgi:hypothetical protein